MLAKWLIIGGIGLILIGAAVWLGTKLGIPFGQLPGDIQVKRENTSFYFPIVTCIVLSLVFSILLNIILTFFRK